MKKMDKFYEDYWLHREKVGRLHTKDGMWVPERVKIVSFMIEKHKGQKNISCIDIGCGEGTLGKLLKAKFGQNIYLVGCDISTTALKQAHPYYDEVVQIDIESNEFFQNLPNRRFDFVICLEVLEHLFKPEKLLKQFHKLLEGKNGEIIVSFPNIAWYRYRIKLLKGKFPKDYLFHSGEHIQHFDLHSFKELLEKENFAITEIGGKYVYPRLINALAPILKKLPNLFGYQIVIKARPKKIQGS